MFKTIGLLFLSNLFMTCAWYGHLKWFQNRGLIFVILISWGIAFFEYCLQVPGNRIGANYFTLSQLKVLQEVITMVVFAVFLVVVMKQDIRMDFIWASLCLVAAAYFMFREGITH